MQFPYAVPSGLGLAATQGLWRLNADGDTFDATNGSGGAMPRGTIVAQKKPGAPRFTMALALAGDANAADAIAVALHAVPKDLNGKFRYDGVATVRLLAGEVFDNGVPVYVSATPGVGTTVAVGKRIGVVMDSAKYAGQGTALVLLNCCEPPAPD